MGGKLSKEMVPLVQPAIISIGRMKTNKIEMRTKWPDPDERKIPTIICYASSTKSPL